MKSTNRRPWQWLSALVMTLAAGTAQAHKGSDAYLDIQQLPPSETSMTGSSTQALNDYRLTFAAALRDLDLVVPIDTNADARVTWGEIKAATPQVLAALNANTGLSATSGAASGTTPTTNECALSWQANGLERRGDGVYFRAIAEAHCPAAEPLSFHYRLLKDQDATHRLLIAGRLGGKDLLSTMSPQQGTAPLGSATVATTSTEAGKRASVSSASRWSTLADYFSLGMHHLLEGYDHLAFLLALVLPLQLSLRRPRPKPTDNRRGAGTPAASHWRANWLSLLRTVTAFTVGHSITLILATLGLTEASPAWVEPAIALSIAVTALLNIYPVKWVRFDVLALLFGLIHGFGFAGLLLEMAAPSGLLPWALAGFNLGVEAGQLTAVLGWVLVSQALVGKHWYAGVVVRGGSVVLLLLAMGWFLQRVT